MRRMITTFVLCVVLASPAVSYRSQRLSELTVKQIAQIKANKYVKLALDAVITNKLTVEEFERINNLTYSQFNLIEELTDEQWDVIKGLTQWQWRAISKMLYPQFNEVTKLTDEQSDVINNLTFLQFDAIKNLSDEERSVFIEGLR